MHVCIYSHCTCNNDYAKQTLITCTNNDCQPNCKYHVPVACVILCGLTVTVQITIYVIRQF